MIGHSELGEQPGQNMEHVIGTKMPGDLDRQTLPCELVDHRQHAKRPSVVCPALDEVVGPDVVAPARP